MSSKQVFISYSSKDQSIAFDICRLLEAQGLQCWIAPRDVRPGYDYDEEIIDAIDAVEAMVLILSAHSNESIHVKHEVEYAVSHGKAVFPVRIQEVLPSKKLVLHIGTKHWLDAWKPPLETKIEQLAAAIKGLLGLTDEARPAPVPPAPPIVAPTAAPVPTSTTEPAEQPIIKPTPKAAAAPAPGLPKESTIDLGNGVKLAMIELPGGTFLMGSENGSDDEKPVHEVTVSAFAIGKYPVTQAQWQAVMGDNPSHFKGDDLPVENVSWNDVQEFIKRLNQNDSKYQYRLPTEAEWEYACRTGDEYAGDLDAMAWYHNNSNNQTHPVGQKPANAWGLYDMHGNVWEWCQDWYDSSYYDQNPVTDPQGPNSGAYRVVRGGSWRDVALFWRATLRHHRAPDLPYDGLGVRLLRTAK
jgi:formylglycine-generating enzyme required for sulfatase activity